MRTRAYRKVEESRSGTYTTAAKIAGGAIEDLSEDFSSLYMYRGLPR